MEIHHIGYAVDNIDRARVKFIKLGYRVESKVVIDKKRNVLVQFMENNNYRIEIVCPFDGKKDSPVDSYLTKNGDCPYHICYISDDIEKDVKKLVSMKYILTTSVENAVALENRKVVFLIAKGVGLIELVER